LKRGESFILRIDNLVAGYNEINVINGISLCVETGEIVTIIGPNGAGKSTLMKAIYGLLTPRGGRITFRYAGEEHEISKWKPHQITALGMNYVPQLRNVFPSMSVRENLEMGSFGRWAKVAENVHVVLELFPIFTRRLSQRAGSLSGGERKMLALARALMSEPQLLLLDEPSAGVAPKFVDEIFNKLEEIRQSGISILVVEQNARRSLTISQYGYVLDMGRSRFEGDGPSLLRDDRVIELYLGRRGLGALPRDEAGAAVGSSEPSN
jgi:neutral amino acid transport system ATP-binding protein